MGNGSVSLGWRQAAGFAQTAFSVWKLRDRENQQGRQVDEIQAQRHHLPAMAVDSMQTGTTEISTHTSHLPDIAVLRRSDVVKF
jgi:hypothetical protein